MVKTYWKISDDLSCVEVTVFTFEEALEILDEVVGFYKAKGKHYDIKITKCEVLKEEHS
jgi:hypothetical protein